MTDSKEIVEIDRMQLLCDNLSRGHQLDSAARLAGYPTGANHAVMSSPRFQAFVQEYFRRMLTADVLRAREVLRGFLDDTTLPAPPRIEAAKTLQTWAKQEKAAASGGLDKAPSEMTGDELQAAIAKMQREIGARAIGAKVIDNAPDIEVIEDQSIDILG